MDKSPGMATVIMSLWTVMCESLRREMRIRMLFKGLVAAIYRWVVNHVQVSGLHKTPTSMQVRPW